MTLLSLCPSASALAMAVFDLARRALLSFSLFLASSTLFPHNAGLTIAPVRGQYLLGLGIGDITGYVRTFAL